MKSEKQRIAIAEACGWRPAKPEEYHLDWDVYIERKIYYGAFHDYPDYPNDLNAMHEAENTFKDLGDFVRYCELLGEVVTGRKEVGLVYRTIHATAAQRAEAFLKTLNLWKD